MQACGFRDNYQIVEGAKCALLGISPDDPATLADWRENKNLPFTLLSDSDHKVSESYDFWGPAKILGITLFTGVIRSHVVIDENGNIADYQRSVSPKKSVSRALDFVS